MFCDKQYFVKKLRLSPRKNFTESDLLIFSWVSMQVSNEAFKSISNKTEGNVLFGKHTELKTASKVVRF